MSKGYRVISADCIISITHCYNGVKNNAVGGEPVTNSEATILETDMITYVIQGLVSVSEATQHIEASRFLDEKNSKKASYRPIHANRQPAEGMLFINQGKIMIRDICPEGVSDITDPEHPITLTKVTTTVIRTETKTFVIAGVYHHNPNGWMEIPLRDVKGTTPTKKSAYTFL